MKNLILIGVLLSLCMNTNAQIKTPKKKIDKNTSITGNKPPSTKGLRVSNFRNLSPKRWGELNVPRSTISIAQLNASAVRTWKINPLKQYDSNLKLETFEGLWTRDAWTTKGLSQSEFDRLGSFARSRSASGSSFTFPLFIKFGAVGGAEYRLKVKLTSRNDGFTLFISIDGLISEILLNSRGEANHAFTSENSRPIDIYISSVAKRENYNSGVAISRHLFNIGFVNGDFSEIQIDRIDN